MIEFSFTASRSQSETDEPRPFRGLEGDVESGSIGKPNGDTVAEAEAESDENEC